MGKLDPKKLAFRLLSGNGGLVPAFDAMPTAGALPVGQGEPFDRQVRLLVQEELDARSSKKHSHHNRTVAEVKNKFFFKTIFLFLFFFLVAWPQSAR